MTVRTANNVIEPSNSSANPAHLGYEAVCNIGSRDHIGTIFCVSGALEWPRPLSTALEWSAKGIRDNVRK